MSNDYLIKESILPTIAETATEIKNFNTKSDSCNNLNITTSTLLPINISSEDCKYSLEVYIVLKINETVRYDINETNYFGNLGNFISVDISVTDKEYIKTQSTLFIINGKNSKSNFYEIKIFQKIINIYGIQFENWKLTTINGAIAIFKIIFDYSGNFQSILNVNSCNFFNAEIFIIDVNSMKSLSFNNCVFNDIVFFEMSILNIYINNCSFNNIQQKINIGGRGIFTFNNSIFSNNTNKEFHITNFNTLNFSNSIVQNNTFNWFLYIYSVENINFINSTFIDNQCGYYFINNEIQYYNVTSLFKDIVYSDQRKVPFVFYYPNRVSSTNNITLDNMDFSDSGVLNIVETDYSSISVQNIKNTSKLSTANGLVAGCNNIINSQCILNEIPYGDLNCNKLYFEKDICDEIISNSSSNSNSSSSSGGNGNNSSVDEGHNEDTISENKNQRNQIKIILSICIPVVSIMLFLVLYFYFYKRKKVKSIALKMDELNKKGEVDNISVGPIDSSSVITMNINFMNDSGSNFATVDK